MNHVLWYAGNKEYYVSSTKRNNDVFIARGKRVSQDGSLLQVCAGFVFRTIPEAERKCRDLLKTKLKHGYVLVCRDAAPESVKKYFEAPPDMQVTTEELIQMIAEAKRERYVVFKDVSGIEDGFDAYVQYLGFFNDGEEYVKVYDRFGDIRECLLERIGVMELTEKALEAQEIAKKW